MTITERDEIERITCAFDINGGSPGARPIKALCRVRYHLVERESTRTH